MFRHMRQLICQLMRAGTVAHDGRPDQVRVSGRVSNLSASVRRHEGGFETRPYRWLRLRR
jgi:hypothetical protein